MLSKEPLYVGGYSGLPHIGHGQHLCHLIEYGEATIDDIKSLVKNARWICRKCGRVAANAQNVCEPEQLD